MTAADTPVRRLQRLAQRVAAGEVVFFIGAGFSIDSEDNGANVLIARLLMRLDALCGALATLGTPAQQDAAARLQRGLCETFSLGARPPMDPQAPLDAHLKALAKDYFQINDWICTAYDTLIGLLAESLPAGLADAVRTREAALQAQVLARMGWQEKPRRVRLGPLDLPLLIAFRRYCDGQVLAGNERALAGKVLFLDTMGFADAEVMAGEPMDPDVRRVAQSVEGRLLPRHHALAWFAAEGFAPVVVTTNFDLLLESAWRLAGLVPWNPPVSAGPPANDEPPPLPRNQRYGAFARIAEAWQFFRHGHAQRAAHLHKIHGCAESYRRARAQAAGAADDAGHAALRATLPTIVFTYREIQNWREDTWSRDHLNTLLRTRTVAFSGYGVADPVIHDTFRTIYEEMADVRPAGAVAQKQVAQVLPEAARIAAQRPHEPAPAFVLTPQPEFYATEILRAASLAAGERLPLRGEHPNRVAFHLRWTGKVPSLDDVYRLLYHTCARGQQAQALEAQLMHTVNRLTGHPRPAVEAQAIARHFAALRAREDAQADLLLRTDDGAGTPAERTHRLQALTGWTWNFQRLLLREYMVAENLVRAPAEALQAGQVATLRWWYCPASEHGDWAAWCVVLEIALRRAWHAVAGLPGDWLDDVDAARLAAPDAALPVVALRDPQGVRRALVIELGALRRTAERPLPAALRALPPLRWSLRHEQVPWRHDADAGGGPVPSAAELWAWAALPVAQWNDSHHQRLGAALEEPA